MPESFLLKLTLFRHHGRTIFIGMKPLDFLQLIILQLLKKSYQTVLKNEVAGGNFLGLTLEKSQILKSQLSRKKEQKWNILQISFVM